MAEESTSGDVCETCRFFLKWSANLQVGQFHRFPPRVVNDQADIEAADAFPVVSVGAWCGEFSRAKGAFS